MSEHPFLVVRRRIDARPYHAMFVANYSVRALQCPAAAEQFAAEFSRELLKLPLSRSTGSGS